VPPDINRHLLVALVFDRENVGGPVLEKVLSIAKNHARIVACGMVRWVLRLFCHVLRTAVQGLSGVISCPGLLHRLSRHIEVAMQRRLRNGCTLFLFIVYETSQKLNLTTFDLKF
jgi:hypothetical protein